jgi:hypothetical protein
VRGRGSDQGGRWPVGLWFALVGVSGGTVASFALLGWAFTRGLYTGGSSAEPVEFQAGPVVIEAEEPAADPDAEGTGQDGLAEPGSAAEVDPSPADPRAEPMPDTAVERPVEESAAPSAPEAPAEQGQAGPGDPELVPVEEDEDQDEHGCGEESEAPEWDYDWHREWGDRWHGGWPDGGDDEAWWPRLESETAPPTD